MLIDVKGRWSSRHYSGWSEEGQEIADASLDDASSVLTVPESVELYAPFDQLVWSFKYSEPKPLKADIERQYSSLV
jgi:hypothetical protein